MIRKSEIDIEKISFEYTVSKTDPDYPERLKTIPRPPDKLYVRGALPRDDIPSVAIIGSRNCSAYGQDMSKWFGAELAARGIQIISGMARGVDGTSQWAALRAGGKSYGVLGCGTEVCYPPENFGIYEKLLTNGGVISEFPAGTKPLSRNFPSRNRIISGLADVLLVVEAREKSGTLITVDYALAQGKDVYALPGRIGDPMSAGCNALLHMGALMALSPSDILMALGMDDVKGVMPLHKSLHYGKMNDHQKREHLKKTLREVKKDNLLMPGTGEVSAPDNYCELTDVERPVWEALEDEPLSVQAIYEKLLAADSEISLSISELITILMNMIMKGTVCADGGLYKRPHPPWVSEDPDTSVPNMKIS